MAIIDRKKIVIIFYYFTEWPRLGRLEKRHFEIKTLLGDLRPYSRKAKVTRMVTDTYLCLKI